MPFITADSGLELHYDDQGTGHPLVFIHGWGMSGRVWRFQIDEFASSYRSIAIDLRGHGTSSFPECADCMMSDLAGDIEAVFKKLDIRGVVLIGWSLGAQVAMEACRLIEDRLAALVLSGGTPRFSAGDGYESGLPPQEVRGMAIRIKRDKSRTMGDFFRGMFVAGEMSHEQNQRVVKEIIIPSRQPETTVLLKTLESLAESDQRAILPTIKIPVLLIHGAEDATCLPDASRYMAGKLGNAELVIVAGCGHAPFLSRPDHFNGLLSGFLKRVYAAD